MCGARAALLGMGAVCSAVQADLLAAHAAGEASRFLRLSAAVDELAEALFLAPMEGYIGRVLWALAHLGVLPFEAADDPWGPRLGAVELGRVGRTVDAIAART
jgi:4-hydroxy-tetrahydrodipicolinate synthase